MGHIYANVVVRWSVEVKQKRQREREREKGRGGERNEWLLGHDYAL